MFLSLITKNHQFWILASKGKEKTTQVCSLETGNCLELPGTAWKLFGSLGYSNIYNIPSGHSRNTGLNSDQILARALFQTCVWVSPQEWLSVYIVNNPCVDSLASRAGGNWIHAMLKPLVGKRGGMVQHPLFSLRVHLFSPLLYFFAYLGLALSTSRLQTRMSLNPSLKSPRLC